MLTVDFDRLGVRRGDRLLDLGCGFGRHAFEAARRGAHVVAVDTASAEVGRVRATIRAMADAGELDASSSTATVVQGDALGLPFRPAAFDRIIASEVLEHIVDDRSVMTGLARLLRSGGTMAVTVPRCGPEIVNWLLSDRYHEVPAGHIRIYRRSVLRRRLATAGLSPSSSHHAHALHTPYWWLRSLVGPRNDAAAAVSLYHRLLVWDIESAPSILRAAERALNPIIGKSLVVYVAKVGEPHVAKVGEPHVAKVGEPHVAKVGEPPADPYELVVDGIFAS